MMMNRTICILLLAYSMIMNIDLLAQQHPAEKTDNTPAGKHVKFILPYVYLGNSSYKGGPIRKDDFNKLLKQGLTAHDSLGNKYKVIGFEFSYGEKSLYEDSIGNNIVVTDYLTEYCYGDTLTAGIAASIYDRTKAGDSAYFDKIKVLKYINNSNETVPAGDATLGISMKFALTR